MKPHTEVWPNRITGRVALPSPAPPYMRLRVRLFQMPVTSLPTAPATGPASPVTGGQLATPQLLRFNVWTIVLTVKSSPTTVFRHRGTCTPSVHAHVRRTQFGCWQRGVGAPVCNRKSVTGIPQEAEPEGDPSVLRRNSMGLGGTALRIFSPFCLAIAVASAGNVGCPTASEKSGEERLFWSSQVTEAASGCPIAR
jgi:hypothetical protein